MEPLHEYILAHTEEVPHAHASADLVFFKVSLCGSPSAAQLVELLRATAQRLPGVDLLDGAEHGFIELGGWLGSQGLALRLT